MTMEKMPDARSDISVYCLGRLRLMMMSWSVNGFDKRGWMPLFTSIGV